LIVVQPENRGTLPAILVSLARVMERDEQAVVGFFPCDHDYTRENVFLEGVRRGFRAAEARPKSLILLGERATYAEPSYGYIEPIETRRGRTKTPQPVRKFWEKPSLAEAQILRQQGCLWNMFVMIGRASAFLDLIHAVAPVEYSFFAHMFPVRPDHQQVGLESIYRVIKPSDFSKQVLTKGCSAISVLDVGDTGWNDLGDPQRMMATLAMRGVKSPWRELWTREIGIAAAAS
jgi:mannose-1-phosphate guanylyltransferase